MKTRIITLCLLLIAFTSINVSYAAFPVKEHSAATENVAPATTTATADNSSATTESATASTTTTTKAKHMGFFQRLKAQMYPEIVGGGRPGWPGILSFVFGILALCAFFALPFLLFSIAAVIFGAIGVGQSYSLRLLALIGLIIGILALLALI